MLLLFLLLNLETPLRIPQILLTTPSNVYQFTPLDQYEDFFLSYPFISIKNDSIYFRGSSKVLLLLDGVPIQSINDICFPGIEKIELLAEHAGSPYGDYDAVINIITKKFSREQSEKHPPYSNIKLIKNPDHVQFEIGRMLSNPFDLYISGDLDSTTKFSANLGYQSKLINLRAHYVGKAYETPLLLQGSLFSNFRFSLTRHFFSIIQHLDFENHKFLLGTDSYQIFDKDSSSTSFFIQDYWELHPLLYLVPSMKYDKIKILHPKISVGYIPQINTTIFSSLTQDQLNLGIRTFDSSINAYYMFNEAKQGIEAKLTTPWLWNFKLTTALDLSISFNSSTLQLFNSSTLITEYRKDFQLGKKRSSQSTQKGNLGVYILGDLLSETLRFELRIIDAHIFYRLNSLTFEPLNSETSSYGFNWHFWN